MIVKETIGNVKTGDFQGKNIDFLEIEWFEATKRIQRLKSKSGKEVAIKLLREGQRLREGDVVLEDEDGIIVVKIKPCEAIIIQPQSLLEMGTVCYEIGNKHMPLYIQEDEVLMPFELPMFRWLEASGYKPQKGERKLLNILKSNVEPHQHGGNSLFNKILNMASSKN